MKKAFLLIIIAVTLLFAASCKKSHKEPEIPEDYYKDLSPEGVVFWDAQESVILQEHNIILPNGSRLDDFLKETGNNDVKTMANETNATDQALGPQKAKNQLIGNLTKAALFFTNRDNFNPKDEGANKPAQHGLAYSWGQRNYQIRQVPPGQGNKCPAAVFGLDCSGLLYNLFDQSGIKISSGNADSQRNVKDLEAAIKKAYPNLTKIKVEDLGKIAEASMETGDMIYWIEGSTAHHIGMVLNDDKGKKSIAQSNGSETDDCASNYSLKRGPRFSAIAKAILPKPKKSGEAGGYGDNYSVIRINTELSGKWTFSIRCAGSATALFNLNLDFPVTTANTFTATTTAKDYDGSTNTFNFTFSYDNVKNELVCTYTMTDNQIVGFERKDSFTVDLDKGDDTGFIPAANQYIRNGSGCGEEVRLVNTETQKDPALTQRTQQLTPVKQPFIGLGFKKQP